MRNNISISSFKGKKPRAFLAFACLVVLTEAFVYTNTVDLKLNYYTRFLANEHRLIDQPRDFETVLMGNSIQKTGINASLVDDSFLALGLLGTKPMGHYLLLKRYLAKHEPPRVLFLYVDPEDAHNLFNVILRYFVDEREFAEIFADLNGEERQAFLTKYFASLDHRRMGLTPMDTYKGTNKSFVEALMKNRGYMPSPRSAEALKPGYFTADRRRIQDRISFSQRDWKYLDKLIGLAWSRGIRVVVMGTVLPRELYDLFETNGFLEDYLAFRRELKLRFPMVDLVGEPVLYLDNEFFGDSQHLNQKGAAVYTAYFKERIFRPTLAALDNETG